MQFLPHSDIFISFGKVMVFAVIIINAVIGFLPGSNIAWQAHLGGLVTGGSINFTGNVGTAGGVNLSRNGEGVAGRDFSIPATSSSN